MDYAKFIEKQTSLSAKRNYTRTINNFLQLHNTDSQKYFTDRLTLPKEERTRKFKDDLEVTNLASNI